MVDPFAHALSEGALLCTFCPRRCRLAPDGVGVCGALTHQAGGLRLSRTPGRYRVETLAGPLCRLRAFAREQTVLTVTTPGSGLEAHSFVLPDEDEPRFSPEQVVFAARSWNAGAVYLDGDDPVFQASEGHEILERAQAARLRTGLTTTGFLLPTAREIVFDSVDAVNLRIWSASPGFYSRRFGVRLEPILSTIEWLATRPRLALEVTVPMLPGENDSILEVERLLRLLSRMLGGSVPIRMEGAAVTSEPSASAITSH